MINGHHVYTIHPILPFLYRFRIGTGPWRYAMNGVWVQDLCYEARDRLLCSMTTTPYLRVRFEKPTEDQ